MIWDSVVEPARAFAVAWWFHVRQFSTRRLYLLDALFLPVVLSLVSFYVVSDARRSATTLALGAALMAMWSVALTGSGAALTRLREMGLLEPIVAAPRSLIAALLPITLASATLGLYAVVVALCTNILLFGVRIEIAHPFLFGAALLATVVAVASLGLLLAIFLVVWPAAQSMAGVFEYPVWLLSGALIPLSLLPVWLAWPARLLPPTWGVAGIRSAVSGTAADATGAITACAAVTTICLALGAVLLRRLERQARERGVLALT